MKELKSNSVFRDIGLTHIEKKGSEIYLHGKKKVFLIVPKNAEDFFNSEI